MNGTGLAPARGEAGIVYGTTGVALLVGAITLLLAIDVPVQGATTGQDAARAVGAVAARSAALLWAAACCAVGGCIGFIFGIPRTLSSDTGRTAPVRDARANPAPPVAPAAPAAPGAAPAAPGAAPPAAAPVAALAPATARGPLTAVNTNLEQISDWLTKIIVGVSLVNTEQVGTAMGNAAKTIAASFGSSPHHASLAFAVLVYFGVVGLLAGYLLTRLFLQPAFNAVDTAE